MYPACTRFWKIRNPQPAIFLCGSRQSSPHGVLDHILNFRVNALLAPKQAIKRFTLPHLPATIQQTIDLVRGSALDALHDLGDAVESCRLVERGKDQVNVVRHYHSAMQVEARSISPGAGFQNY